MDFWNTYFFVTVNFFVQLSVAEILFSFDLKHRGCLLIRLLVAYVIGLILALPVTFVPLFNEKTVYSDMIVYFLLFAVSVACLFFVYDEKFTTLLLRGVLAYAAQHMVYQIVILISVAVDLNSLLSDGRLLLLVRYAFCLIFYPIIFFLFSRPMRSVKMSDDLKKYIVIISGIVLTVTIVLNSVRNLFLSESAALTLVTCVLFILCCLAILVLCAVILRKIQLENEISVMKYIRRQEKEQYDLVKENIDIINIKCHDMKFLIGQRQKADKAVGDDYFEDIEAAIGIYDSTVETGNATLDVILTEKSLYCEKNHISLTCVADGKLLDFMKEADIVSLFGNALENALEHVAKIADNEKRFIRLRVVGKGELLSVTVENWCAERLTFENDLPVTTKRDKHMHGYGMKSIKNIVDKYGGNMSVVVVDNIFYLTLVFPVTEAEGGQAR